MVQGPRLVQGWSKVQSWSKVGPRPKFGPGSKRLELAQGLGQLGVFLTRVRRRGAVAAGCVRAELPVQERPESAVAWGKDARSARGVQAGVKALRILYYTVFCILIQYHRIWPYIVTVLEYYSTRTSTVTMHGRLRSPVCVKGVGVYDRRKSPRGSSEPHGPPIGCSLPLAPFRLRPPPLVEALRTIERLPGEKGVRLAQNMRVSPCITVGKRL